MPVVFTLLQHSIFAFDALQNTQQRFSENQHNCRSTQALGNIHSHPRHKHHSKSVPIQLSKAKKQSHTVQNRANDQHHRQEAKYSHKQRLSGQTMGTKAEAGQHSPRAEGKHLPRGIGALAQEEITAKEHTRFVLDLNHSYQEYLKLKKKG